MAGYATTPIADMAATNTAYVTIQVSGSSKSVDVDNSATGNWFSGCLLA